MDEGLRQPQGLASSSGSGYGGAASATAAAVMAATAPANALTRARLAHLVEER
jgi:hypothetical protein